MQADLLGKRTYHFFIPRQEYPLTHASRKKQPRLDQRSDMRRYSRLRQPTARMDRIRRHAMTQIDSLLCEGLVWRLQPRQDLTPKRMREGLMDQIRVNHGIGIDRKKDRAARGRPCIARPVSCREGVRTYPQHIDVLCPESLFLLQTGTE